MLPIQDPIEQTMIYRTRTTYSPQHEQAGNDEAWSCTPPSPGIMYVCCDTKQKQVPRKSCLASKNPKRKKISTRANNEKCVTSARVVFRQPTRWEASEATDRMPRQPSRQRSVEAPSGSDSLLDEVIANVVSTIIRLEHESTRQQNSLASKAAWATPHKHQQNSKNGCSCAPQLHNIEF